MARARLGSLLIAVMSVSRLPAAPPPGRVPTTAEDHDAKFAEAVRRVSSPDYASRRWESIRKQNVADQLALQSLVLWRSGIVSPQAPLTPLSVLAGGVSRSPAWWPGSPDLYSPYYFGPFEPTPFWPGYIWGYPYTPFIEQPVGYRITTNRGDAANGAVYEPVYADDDLEGAEVITPVAQYAEPDPDLRRFAELDDLDVALEPASVAFRNEDYRRALAELTRLPDDARLSGRAELLKAGGLFALESYRAAAKAQHAALAELPEEFWRPEADQAASRYASPAKYDELVVKLEQFVKAEPNSPEARFLLGYHYGFRGFPRDAVRQLRFALDLGLAFDSPAGPVAPADDPVAVALLRYFQAQLPADQAAPRGPVAF